MTYINEILFGDIREKIKSLPDKYIDCVITSPPYWQLRDYGFPEQLGLEPTYQEYLENLWLVMNEIWRILKDEGTVWINLGDTYATKSGNMGVAEQKENFSKDRNTNFPQSPAGKLHKCLLLIPHRFAIGCIDRGWIIRNDIIWAKRNGMPESVQDRFSKKHEYFFFMVKQQKYYFDLDSIKDETLTKDNSLRNRDITKLNNTPGRGKMGGLKTNNYNYKNPGSVSDFWDIATKPNDSKHYATYNTNLIDKPIIAGCPENGIILDPFCGTGTTLIRGLQLNRKVIGIEGNKEYYQNAIKSINDELSVLKLFHDN